MENGKLREYDLVEQKEGSSDKINTKICPLLDVEFVGIKYAYHSLFHFSLGFEYSFYKQF